MRGKGPVTKPDAAVMSRVGAVFHTCYVHAVRFGILGPLAVWNNGEELPLGGVKRRAVLGLLLTRANELIPTGTLVDELWGEQPPATAVKAVQVHISQLRKIIGPGVLQTRPAGYLLEVERSALDAFQFEDLLAQGRRLRAEGDVEGAVRALREGLSLWRGPPLADLRYEQFARNESGRLEELRLVALEDCLDAELALGRAGELVGELESLVRQNPLRERPRALLMLALYRGGRQADALAAYQDARARLLDELGLDPGDGLQQLERAILRHDPSLDLALPSANVVRAPTRQSTPATACPSCGERTAPGAEFCQRCGSHLRPDTPLARKVVTVLLCDIVTTGRADERVDPEALHLLLSRHFEQATTVVEQYGGTVEKLIGDELLAVFGVPTVREDDALRAVRAALAVRESTAALGAELGGGRVLQARIGVNTGEVVAGDPSGGPGFVTGDAVSLCKRLEQAAAPGEILVGEDTYALVAHAVRGSLREPTDPNGETAFSLESVEADASAIPRRDDAPLVGRERELDRLRIVFSEVAASGGGRLALILGDAGIGKSRLTSEFLAELGDYASVLVGRCPPYGEAVTFSPMREVLQQADHSTDVLEGSTHDVFSAVRRILEDLADERPLVVVLDDVQWAEPTLLDLIEYLAARFTAVPVLLICLARPQLRDERPAWLQESVVLALEPLSTSESEAMLEALGAPAAVRARIAGAAEGNPLFVEQLAAIAEEDESGLAIPGSIRGVLHARLDRLDSEERVTVERAAVAGRSFSFESVLDLTPTEDRENVETHLLALVRQGFVRPETIEFEEGYRFQHALIRDAAYEGIPKARRADLHLRMAERLDASGGPALVGYHLEQAYRLRADLGVPDPALAARAGRRLRSAGEQAFGQTDLPATIAFFRRALSLLPTGEAAVLGPELAQALFESGRLGEADEVLSEALDGAQADPALAARVLLEQQFVNLQADPLASGDKADEVAAAAFEVFVENGDEHGMCRAACLQASVAWNRGQTTSADGTWHRAAGHARAAGNERELFEILGWRASAALYGPRPVEEAIRTCTEIREQVQGSPVAVAVTLHPLAALYAMGGEFDEARLLVIEANVVLAELGRLQSTVSHQEAMIEMLAGDPAAAEAVLRAGYEKLEAMGERAFHATTAALLAQTLYAQGREDEADSLCAVSERTAADDDIASQITWRGVRAKLAAREGRSESAEALALEAVRLVEDTDLLNQHGEALTALAETYRLSSRPADADAAARAAFDLFSRKGNVVSAGRAQSLVASPIPP
jgi:class 3 adenylate cyclase/DNA-binding SARP family transcriptional activator